MNNDNLKSPPSSASAGSHGEPVAWGVATSGGSVIYTMRTRSEAARYVADETNIVPLYRSPTLTDAEWEAIERLCEAVVEYAADDRKTNGETFAADDERAVAIVRGWLARLTWERQGSGAANYER